MALPRLIVNDGPEDHCFGCGHQNQHGLRLAFRVLDDGTVEADYTAPEHFCGAPNVVHGGIQATLLDEIMGMAVHAATDEARTLHVTVDLKLRYRRPTPSGAPLTLRAHVTRVDGRDVFSEGQILDGNGEVLTRAESRFRLIA